MAKASNKQLNKMLFSWNEMNRDLGELTLEDLREIYEIEQTGKNRTHMKLRIHQRHNRLRFLQEQEIIKEGKDVILHLVEIY